MDIKLLKISDFNNDFTAFVEACYSCYLSIWQNEVRFNNKPILRNRTLEDGKEKDFWGVVEGHTNDKVFDDLSRYETIPCLKYVLEGLSKTKNDHNSDIIWFVFDRKINIISKKVSYFVVLKEGANNVYFITSYPVGEVKKGKIVNKWKEYWSLKNQSR